MSEKKKKSSKYSEVWNTYVVDRFPEIKSKTPHAHKKLAPWRVLNTKDEKYDWPGDEWGERELVCKLFDETVTSALDGKASYLCELGSGAGRYTVLAFERFPEASILSFDVSREFEISLRERCESFIQNGRLKTSLLNEDPLHFINTVRQENLEGKIDAIYSFDAMVHVDLHTLFVYWLSAAKSLRAGGVLAMNVANACSENGFMKLLFDSPGVYTLGGNSGGHFMWISRDIVETSLTRLGFEVTITEGNGRDLSFVAKLVNPEKAAAWFQKAGAGWFQF